MMSNIRAWYLVSALKPLLDLIPPSAETRRWQRLLETTSLMAPQVPYLVPLPILLVTLRNLAAWENISHSGTADSFVLWVSFSLALARAIFGERKTAWIALRENLLVFSSFLSNLLLMFSLTQVSHIPSNSKEGRLSVDLLGRIYEVHCWSLQMAQTLLWRSHGAPS